MPYLDDTRDYLLLAALCPLVFLFVLKAHLEGTFSKKSS
jgi:hypothetical protein